jgi:membrane-bound lytic murein transglycosylase D
MHHRKVKSLVKGIAGAALLIAAAQPHAETAGPSLIASLFSASATPSVTSADGALTVQEVVAAPAVARSIDLTAQPDNIWDRIRLGFAMTNLNDDLTLHYQQWYQNHPDAMRRMVERSRPYLHHIVEELEARGMPTELALLPMVESSFNPMAYSGAHASGLWQFIPATGKRFNLEQNWWHDQRRDIIASTGAALEYLQTIYEMHGDWHLALASYNWGEGAVKRAIEKNQARDLPTDYASLTMPKETRHYVPKLQALKNIFSNTTLVSQLGLPEVMNRPYFATVTTSRPMDVKAAARLANMPVNEFVALNPAHNRPVMKADTPVVIPADRMATFQSNLERHEAPLTEWEVYTLKPGERLEQIAQRSGIALAELLRANGLQGKVRLGAGSTLLVPAGMGGEGLHALDGEPRLAHVAEPEVPRAKAAKGAAKGQSAKAPKTAAAKPGGPGKTTIAKAGAPAKAAAAKAATSAPATKVARSGNGRRS